MKSILIREKCKKAYQEGLLQKQFDKDMEIEQLKQQLAEKDKKIANIKNSCDYYMKRANDLVLKQNQKAIEQLEKVKKEFNERKLEYITMETKTHIYGLRIDRINELIDNQINELKGKVEDVKD